MSPAVKFVYWMMISIGYKARQLYKRMQALMVMVKAYRLKKMRVYINQLQSKFQRAKTMKDYGKSIIWPAPPRALHVSSELCMQKIKWI